MSTVAPVFVEFRCNRCWYSNCADSEAVGTKVECRNCGQETTVPEATPDRIARAETLLSEQPASSRIRVDACTIILQAPEWLASFRLDPFLDRLAFD